MVTRVDTVWDTGKRQQTENGPSGLHPAEADASNFGESKMQNNGTATLARSEGRQVSPVIDRTAWVTPFEAEIDPEAAGRTVTLRLEFPVQPDLMVAALYYERTRLNLLDLMDDAYVWQLAALVLLESGYDALATRAEMLDRQITHGLVEDPAWLARARRRVAEVTGQSVTRDAHQAAA
jgi:hypothetical protein